MWGKLWLYYQNQAGQFSYAVQLLPRFTKLNRIWGICLLWIHVFYLFLIKVRYKHITLHLSFFPSKPSHALFFKSLSCPLPHSLLNRFFLLIIIITYICINMPYNVHSPYSVARMFVTSRLATFFWIINWGLTSRKT